MPVQERDLLLKASSAPGAPFLSGCRTKASFLYALLMSPSSHVLSTAVDQPCASACVHLDKPLTMAMRASISAACTMPPARRLGIRSDPSNVRLLLPTLRLIYHPFPNSNVNVHT